MPPHRHTTVILAKLALLASTSCGARTDFRGGSRVDVPMPVAPLTGSRVTTFRPTLHWRDLPGAFVRVDLCRDRPCTQIEHQFDASGTSARVASDLSPGIWFWRLTAHLADGSRSASTTPRWFRVPRRDTPVDTSWGAAFDPDGDGRSELAVGETGRNDGPSYVHIFTTESGSLVRSTTLPADGLRVGLYGYALATGDFDGDAFADLAIGAPSVWSSTGEVEIFRGSANGLLTEHSVRLSAPSTSPANWGGHLASAGDVNRDGYADLAVGATIGSGHRPRAFVLLGGPDGLPSTPSVTLAGTDVQGERFADFVSSAGDLDGDGYGDLVVGAPPFGQTPPTGRLYVYYGSESGIDATPSMVIEQAGFSDQWAVTGGDLDSDGYADLVVGANADGRRRLFVYRGGPDGVSRTASWETDVAEAATFWPRTTTSTAVDLDRDGYDDVLLAQGRGAAALVAVHGGPAGPDASRIVVRAPTADEGTDFPTSLAFVDVDGDGQVEIAVGAASDVTRGGRVEIFPAGFEALLREPEGVIRGPIGGSGFLGRAMLGVEAP